LSETTSKKVQNGDIESYINITQLVHAQNVNEAARENVWRQYSKAKNILLGILMKTFTVKRSEEHAIKTLKGWLLVYGRRKTGKNAKMQSREKHVRHN